MTQAEQALADDKMRAEIAKLIAETAKINKETRWYELVVIGAAASALTLAAVAVGQFLFS
ncbi:MAG: hypothetical protein AAGG09_14275 [Pseudomonadota bacterium]